MYSDVLMEHNYTQKGRTAWCSRNSCRKFPVTGRAITPSPCARNLSAHTFSTSGGPSAGWATRTLHLSSLMLFLTPRKKTFGIARFYCFTWRAGVMAVTYVTFGPMKASSAIVPRRGNQWERKKRERCLRMAYYHTRLRLGNVSFKVHCKNVCQFAKLIATYDKIK